jgi:hypothetical protein
MNNHMAKKLRKQYRKRINDATTVDLRKEIFRPARNRDILGILLIFETIIFIVYFIFSIN